MNRDLDHFLFALALTLSIEIPVLFLSVRKFLKIPHEKISTRRLACIGLIASSVTLPFLWFVLPQYIRDYSAFLFTGETAVFLVEAFLYIALLRVKPSAALLISLLCNVASFAGGYCIQYALNR